MFLGILGHFRLSQWYIYLKTSIVNPFLRSFLGSIEFSTTSGSGNLNFGLILGIWDYVLTSTFELSIVIRKIKWGRRFFDNIVAKGLYFMMKQLIFSKSVGFTLFSHKKMPNFVK